MMHRDTCFAAFLISTWLTALPLLAEPYAVHPLEDPLSRTPTNQAAVVTTWWLHALNQTNAVQLFNDSGKALGKISATPAGSTGASATGRYEGKVQKAGSSFNVYDQRNRMTGRASVSENSVRLYSPRGRYTGRMTRSGKSVLYHDKTGKYLGKSVTDILGNQTYYDAQGRPTGKINL